MANDELAFVEWLRRRCTPNNAVEFGIGDDMAVVRGAGRILLASDMLLDGVHFDSRQHSWRQIGRKALACNLSDCAAMAVCPIAATVSLALPRSMAWDDVQQLCEGLFALAQEYNVGIAGGDTNRWAGDSPLAIDVAIVARPYPDLEPVTRAGARAGDRLFVTGPLGGSILGRHLGFTPRVREAYQLARQLGPGLHAMMDISDGLALDLWRMCEASGVGAELSQDLIQAIISEDARRLSSTDGRSAMEHALGDGEDFELLLAVDGAVGVDLPVLPIGRIVGEGLSMVDATGLVMPLEPKGFVH